MTTRKDNMRKYKLSFEIETDDDPSQLLEELDAMIENAFMRDSVDVDEESTTVTDLGDDSDEEDEPELCAQCGEAKNEYAECDEDGNQVGVCCGCGY
jgi:hypothetical protein